MGACLASDRITVDGQYVGHMYRETTNDPMDSGWRFLAGDEAQEYCDNSGNFGLFAVNTIANYDRSIIPLLDIEAPCAFVRDGAGSEFRAVTPITEC